MLMNGGRYGTQLEKRLLSEQTVNELLSPQTLISTGKADEYQTHFGAYGLGWFMNDERGYKLIFHTGQDVGMVSQMCMIPELGLGVVVLTNSESMAAGAITDQIIDSYIGIKGKDRSLATFNRWRASQLKIAKVRDSVWRGVMTIKQSKLPIATQLTGIYHDRWFGDVTISVRNHELYFRSRRSPQLRGRMLPFKKDSYFVRWENPEVDADTFIHFSGHQSAKSKTITLEPAVPGGGLNFEGLLFSKVQ